MDSSDWSNGIRYHIFDTSPDTEFKMASYEVASIISLALNHGCALDQGVGTVGGVPDYPGAAEWFRLGRLDIACHVILHVVDHRFLS